MNIQSNFPELIFKGNQINSSKFLMFFVGNHRFNRTPDMETQKYSMNTKINYKI